MRIVRQAILAMIAAAIGVVPAAAQSGSRHTVAASAEVEDFNRGLGSRRSAQLDYRIDTSDTTLTFTTTAGERRSVTTRDRSVGAGASLSHKWSSAVSTRSSVFVSQKEPVFARLDVAQDVTFNLVKDTNVTLGGRYARFVGGPDVRFASAGVRQYFRGGSVAYRLSLVDPDNRGTFLAHLVNLSVRDAQGDGQTRLWLSAGEASYTRPRLGGSFSGKDLGAVIQRSQPLTGPLALTVTAGVASYGRPGPDVTSTTFGLGLSSRFGDVDRSPGR